VGEGGVQYESFQVGRRVRAWKAGRGAQAGSRWGDGGARGGEGERTKGSAN
jgi:hypothetical protein